MDDETDPTFLMRRAVDAHGQGDFADAEGLYRAAAQAGDSEAAFQLGLLLEDDRRYQEAADAYRQAILSGDRDARLNLANLLADVDAISDLDGAERLYQEAIAAGDARALFDYGTVLARLERDSEAEGLFIRAIELQAKRAVTEALHPLSTRRAGQRSSTRLLRTSDQRG